MNTTSKKSKYKEVYRVSDIAIHGFFEEHRFLSNFELCDIMYDGLLYGSTEAAYQSAKFPKALRKQFQYIGPNDAKLLGRSLKMNRDQTYKWDHKKLDVMREVCEYKFLNHPELAKKLLDTEDKYLEETNWWSDGYWGVCKRHGLNHLGRILMDIRNGIRLEQEM